MENPQLNLTLDQTQPVLCEECGGHYFDQTLHIRKASGLLTGTGQPTYMPIPVFACKACGHVNTEFLPRELKDLDAGEDTK